MPSLTIPSYDLFGSSVNALLKWVWGTIHFTYWFHRTLYELCSNDVPLFTTHTWPAHSIKPILFFCKSHSERKKGLINHLVFPCSQQSLLLPHCLRSYELWFLLTLLWKAFLTTTDCIEEVLNGKVKQKIKWEPQLTIHFFVLTTPLLVL